MNDRELDRLIRATYAGLRARGRPARRANAWVPAIAVAAAIVAGLALGAALGRSRITPAAPTNAPVATHSAAPTAQVGGPAPTPRRPAPTSVGTVAPGTNERNTWAKVRTSLADPAAVITPTWLPSTVDRDVTSAGASLESYEFAYGIEGRGTVFLTMGPMAPEQAGISGIGLSVRGHPAILSHDPDAHARPGLPKLVSWSEDGRHYGIRSQALSGDDLMRIAWSMESPRPPARPHPYARVSVGACSVPGIEADVLLRRLMSIVGSGDPEAIADCFALETLESSPGAWRSWASLPRARDVIVSLDPYWFGGRQVLGVSWTFERDPGGAWNPSPHQFLMVGVDDDRLRVYYVWTAPASLPR